MEYVITYKNGYVKSKGRYFIRDTDKLEEARKFKTIEEAKEYAKRFTYDYKIVDVEKEEKIYNLKLKRMELLANGEDRNSEKVLAKEKAILKEIEELREN